MRFLFKLIVLPILSIIFVPLMILIFAYKPVEIPVDDFDLNETINLTSMITEQMDIFLEENDQDSEIGIGFSQQQANGLLLNTMRSQNVHYLDEDAPTDDDKDYVLKEDFFGYQGSWIRFKEDTIEIESGAHIFIQGFTYKTRLLLVFEFTADADEVVLTLKKVNIGNIPLAWMFSVASWVAEKVTGFNIQEMIDQQLNGLATFDPAKREIRLEIQTLVESAMSDDPQSAALVNSLLQFIKENELLDIGFEDEIFEASLALGRTRDITAPFVLSELEVITDETEFQTIMASKVSNLVLSTLDPNADDPYIEFDAFLLNRIFEYMLRDQLSGHGVIHETVLFENYLMKALVPYVTMGEFFVVNIPISIEKVAEPTHRFQTIIKIEATPSLENNDLKIVLNDLDAGDVTLAGEHIENILVLLGDSDFIQEGAFVIEDFDSQISQPGMSIKSVDMVNSKLRVSVGLDDSLNLGDLADAIETVLDIISNNSYSPEVDDAISNLLDSLTDVEIDTTEAIEALIEVLDEMTPEEQQAFFDDLLEELGDTDFPFGDLFESLP